MRSPTSPDVVAQPEDLVDHDDGREGAWSLGLDQIAPPLSVPLSTGNDTLVPAITASPRTGCSVTHGDYPGQAVNYLGSVFVIWGEAHGSSI